VKKVSINLKIIGVVHSPYKSISDAPFQGKNEISEIEVDRDYLEGLQDIEGFTHLHILFWLHKSTDFSLLVKTPWDTIPHGIFSTRSPHRPNPIGHAVVELVERKNNKIIVKGLDAIEGTPIIDIKPYVKSLDIKDDASSGWLEKGI
jgi:formylmethanofuran dehydrogenase subunit E